MLAERLKGHDTPREDARISRAAQRLTCGALNDFAG